MARIRRIEISNFRSIKSLDWAPSAGLNCLIGPGDSGKSSILDAIDLCLGARRNAVFYDTDFFNLDVAEPIVISLTMGDLPDTLKNIESYGDFLRGFDDLLDAVEDEPGASLETVITLRLTVASDLEPSWTLFSERASAAETERNLAWKDRLSITPARIGSYTSSNLSWTRGSILNRITEERASLGAELAAAARQARTGFGTQAADHLSATLKVVTDTANKLGVPVGSAAQALLDAHAVSISGGAIALHNEGGVPLRSLGTGSSRLLIAGLQRAAAEAASILLVDEVEHGLEPHRLTQLLHSLGAKASIPPLQVFMTTHSPVAVRELTGDQLFVVRPGRSSHKILKVGITNDVQSTVRADPKVFLSKSIVVCEGASEVGFSRGLDQYWIAQGEKSFYSLGGAYANVGGRTADLVYQRGTVLCGLGYRVLVLADADQPATQSVVDTFNAAGGTTISWRPGRALEDELFFSLSDDAVEKLLQRAIELVGEDLVSSHIQSQSNGKLKLQEILDNSLFEGFPSDVREILGKAAKNRNNGWFKSLTKYENIANDIIGPDLAKSDKDFASLVSQLKDWMHAS